MTLLEPTCPDSLLAWGFFPTCFARKEYMESYVTEDVAQRMMADDPALKAQCLGQLASGKEFAASPKKRLEFFQRRHPSWDERLDLYPVTRVATAPRAWITIDRAARWPSRPGLRATQPGALRDPCAAPCRRGVDRRDHSKRLHCH